MEQTNRRKTGQANNVKYGLLVEQRLRPYCAQPSSFTCQLHAPQTCLYTLYTSVAQSCLKHKGLFTAHQLNRYDLNSRPVTQGAHWSRESASRLYFVLIGCSETRTVSARLVLNTCIPIPMRLFEVECASSRSRS